METPRRNQRTNDNETTPSFGLSNEPTRGTSGNIGLNSLLQPPKRVPISICSSSESLGSCLTTLSASECSVLESPDTDERSHELMPRPCSSHSSSDEDGKLFERTEQRGNFEEYNQDARNLTYVVSFGEERFFSTVGNHEDNWDDDIITKCPAFEPVSLKILSLPREIELSLTEDSWSAVCMEDF